MDNQRIPPLSWGYYYQGKNMDELRHSLLYTTLELETTKLAAQEEIRKREEQMNRLQDLLNRAIRERDEAQDKCQRLLVEKLLLLQQQHQHLQQPQQNTPLSGISSIEDEARRGGDSNTGISSSDCEESIVSSPVMDPIPPPPLQPPSSATTTTTTTPTSGMATVQLPSEKPLPEKGKLLQAVMKAGPLLQTLLLAGPLPQWRHPPPQLDSFEIPPVAITSPPTPHLLHQDSVIGINGDINNTGGGIAKRKRGLMVCEGSDSSTKYQRVVLR
ncbi:uncharacterized protein LOC122649467 [Telopea speciosissima]|uniref:uncharacterized protein LOC122649467 n=1 Tax=Telopea speciosissima TaxID=54955 RepID=UPI001CC46643|nr:uncharacterized protein LOC122649467 [Telopea speciosissima]